MYFQKNIVEWLENCNELAIMGYKQYMSNIIV